jgi:hypothetical protein
MNMSAIKRRAMKRAMACVVWSGGVVWGANGQYLRT